MQGVIHLISLAVFLHTNAVYGHTTYSCHTSPEQHSSGHHYKVCWYLVSCTPSSDLTIDILLIQDCSTVEWVQVTRAVQIVAVIHATQPANHTATVTCPTLATSCGEQRRRSWVSLEACGRAGRQAVFRYLGMIKINRRQNDRIQPSGGLIMVPLRNRGY